jgi:hypothetical protein
MSDVLKLAADFIERMSNPGYGIRVNEDYALRLGSLLATEGFDGLLRREIAQIRDTDTLSPHGWLWLLNWARAKGIRLDDKLLLHLAEMLSSVFMQVVVIDVATRHIKWNRREAVTSIEKFGDSWLSQLMHRCTKIERLQEAEDEHIDTRRSESVLVALMQVGSDITLDAASTLLNHRWKGQQRLIQYFWSLCDEVDEETQNNWISRLQPP